MKKLMLAIAAGTILPLVSFADEPTTIYRASFTTASERQFPNKTDLGLTVNLPNATWIWNRGWDWGKPFIAAAWDNVGMQDALILAEEEWTAICLPLASAGDYVKPARLRVSADIYEENKTVALGFWPTAENIADVGSRNSAGELTGLGYDAEKKVLRLYVNGVAGQEVSVVADETGDGFQNLSYTVNTANGKLELVQWNGQRINGFSTSAFTDEATAFVGVSSAVGSAKRSRFKNFEVAVGEAAPQPPEITVSPVRSRVFSGTEVMVSATAVMSETGVAMPVTVKETTCTGYSFTDGLFRWTAGEKGEYTVVFASANGDEVAEATATISVIAQSPLSDDPVVIYETDFQPDDQYRPMDGTKIGLETNLPDGSWSRGSGMDYPNPELINKWDAPEGRVKFGDRWTALGLPLASSGDYVRPSTFTLTAEISSTEGLVGVGFSRSCPQMTHGGDEPFTWNPDTEFTGVVWEKAKGCLQVRTAGGMVGEAVSVPTSDAQYQQLLLTVDTASGNLLFVQWNGKPVSGLESDAFTEANTLYAALAEMEWGRMEFHSFQVTEGRSIPKTPVIEISAYTVSGFDDARLQVSASARRFSDNAPLPVSFDAPEGLVNCEIANGVFSCEAAAPGRYYVTFSAENEGETASEQVEFRFYAPPPKPPKTRAIYTAAPKRSENYLRYAGSVMQDISDSTDYGLTDNVPGAKWLWASGYHDCWPFVGNDGDWYDFCNEKCAVLLPIESSGSFARPARLRFEATVDFTGVCAFGFWSGLPEKDGNGNADNVKGFLSGIEIETYASCAWLVIDGKRVGSSFPIEMRKDGKHVYDVSFEVDLRKGRLANFSWGDYYFPEVVGEGFTEERTPYVGVATLGNSGGDSRLRLLNLRIAEITPPGLVIYVK